MHTNKCDSVWLYVKKSYKETFINSRICLNITIQNNQKKSNGPVFYISIIFVIDH